MIAENIEVTRFASDTELAVTAASHWLQHLAEQLEDGKRETSNYSVALSGGRITKTFFNALVQQACADPSTGDLLRTIHYYWADERCVPPSDPECNYAIAKQLLFDPLHIPDTHIHRIRGENPEPEAVRNALEDLGTIVPVENGHRVLDMVFLGMGEDGHVASLFPGESQAVMNDPAIYRAVTATKPPPKRITLGYSTIIAARNVWVLASGTGKEAAFQASLQGTGNTPLGRVLRARNRSKVLTDINS